jgi:DNA-binding NarL/FixJ family response regulator
MTDLGTGATQCNSEVRSGVYIMGESVIYVVLAGNCHSRSAICTLLSSVADIVVVAETENSEKLLDLVSYHQPDVTVLELPMPGNNGVEVIRHLRANGSMTGILVLTTSEDPRYIKAALDAGANGYIVKSSTAEEIIDGVRAVDEANQVLLQKYVWEPWAALKPKGDSLVG